MPGQRCDVLDILRLELEFLELDLYSAPTPGRPLLIFQDSPTCPRYGAATCPNCALTQFAPPECRFEPVPCHHIRLNDACETVDSLYRTGTQDELEEVLRNWLTATIKSLEEKQIEARKIPSFERSPRKPAA
ncbi:MAG TPA: hypothetical protein VNZ03_34705 [Terriglobales bacterium]|jgi:hypothetical protein|nr:hypothetical protein [Terriglobales bacterium]